MIKSFIQGEDINKTILNLCALLMIRAKTHMAKNDRSKWRDKHIRSHSGEF